MSRPWAGSLVDCVACEGTGHMGRLRFADADVTPWRPLDPKCAIALLPEMETEQCLVCGGDGFTVTSGEPR